MTTALPAPVDVKLMNGTASVLFVVFACLSLGTLCMWVLRQPVFAIGGVEVRGEVTHNNVVTLRANVAPKLRGTFFTVDLADTRAAFEAVPWVRRAVVRRSFPNRLDVTLQEHQAAAYWGAESGSQLLNSFGEIFEANVAEVHRSDLPRLAGPDDQSGLILGMYRTLAPLFDPLDSAISELELTGRGSWRVQLDSGAVVELGRGTPEELTARIERFAKTLTTVAGQYGRGVDALEAADLRYPEGYALRLRGVTTVTTAVPPPRRPGR
ncbi:cell division protein FtsQ/DivIB [Pseudorhodoferax sp. Leaf267]|uniref:cell division protein FtsQ/DivIB n=1 Tax=Pseudorhodoferax sp. Leaf267 TaxID=1736316 RepID=UPI0006F37940|nr:cell division protein FtsQ/DivIB [Pseudorhodoferax sp. Leaf267]KQP14140.1 cell division protein FtsQ [Pseudorhodoferax sp. Leaf267]